MLVGTISVEVSELLSERLRKRGIEHTVLNAKPEHAAREAEIVAEAGRPGAVTIATNMAGRGVDIKLGGNPEHLARQELAKEGLEPDAEATRRAWRLAAKIEAAGRRRPRAGARRPAACSSAAPSATSRGASTTSCAGAPGARATRARRASSSPPRTISCGCSPAIASTASSTSSASVDDEGNEEPIEAGMLSKQIEKAQKKVEEQNFLIRKRVLEYDDVMNEQRRVIYAYRDQVLEGNAASARRRASEVAAVHRAHDRRVHAGRLRRGLGYRRSVRRALAVLPASTSPRATSTRTRSTAS